PLHPARPAHPAQPGGGPGPAAPRGPGGRAGWRAGPQGCLPAGRDLAAVPAGPVLLAVALWRRSLRASLLAGLIFGLAFFVPLLSWLVNVAWYAWLALAVAEAVIIALLAVGQRLLLNLRAWPLAVAGWWVCAE